MLRRSWPLVLALLCLASPAWSWKDRVDGEETNLRVSLETGYLEPVWFQGFDYGADAGLGLEIEQSPGVSYVFHLSCGRLWTTAQPTYTYPFYYDYSSDRLSRAIFSWNVGARGYLRARDVLRPFAELDAGLRLVDSIEPAEGLMFSPRLGVSIGRSGGPALSLASGVDFNARTPRLHGVVPVQLGVVLASGKPRR